MKKISSLALCLLVLTGCSAQQPKLVQKVDPYTQKAGLGFGPIGTKHCPGDGYDGIYAHINILKDGDLQVLNITIEAQKWAFLNPGLPLNVLIDGHPTQLTAIKGSDRDTKREHGYVAVTESLYYPVSQSFVSRLAGAQSVQFRVPGEKRTVERCLDATALRQLERVVPFLTSTP